MCQPLRLTQALQGLGKPRPRHQLRPLSIRRINRIIKRCTGHQAHCLGKGQAGVCRRLLDGLEARQHALELVAIHLYPAPANQLQAVGPFEQRPDISRTERLAIERDLHAEIEQRIFSQQ